MAQWYRLINRCDVYVTVKARIAVKSRILRAEPVLYQTTLVKALKGNCSHLISGFYRTVGKIEEILLYY
jgi:hypothetical protein